jgi:anti-anti-sigma factor
LAVIVDGALSHHPGVVTLSGDLDAAEHDTVRDALAAALAAAPAADDACAEADIVVDLAAVRFMDAGTVGLLLEASRTAADAGRRLRVIGARATVRQVIQASGSGFRLLGPATGDRDAVAPGSADRQRAAAQRHQVEADQIRILARFQQLAIDGEVRATRRRLLSDLRKRLRIDPWALANEGFLAIADAATVLDAIVLAATSVGAADACDLQVFDPHTGTLQIARQRGFTADFLAYFATVELRQPTACATAAVTGEPVIVDDVAASPLFAGQPALEIMLAAGSRAVHSHPLHDDARRLLGVLSFHYRSVKPRHGDQELVARALSGTVPVAM